MFAAGNSLARWLIWYRWIQRLNDTLVDLLLVKKHGGSGVLDSGQQQSNVLYFLLFQCITWEQLLLSRSAVKLILINR
jgi:hypothetical protein